MRRALAFPVFALSRAAFGLGLVYPCGLTDGGKVMDAMVNITGAVIAALQVLLGAYACAVAARGLLR